jgi:hypothetical protein
VLIQVGVPSRVQVKEYQKLASQVNELVGRINGSFGTANMGGLGVVLSKEVGLLTDLALFFFVFLVSWCVGVLVCWCLGVLVFGCSRCSRVFSLPRPTGTLDYTPIHYIQRPVSTEELCALYNVADACIIT